jgi:steroid delta-isomerase-like uncharacterized protein
MKTILLFFLAILFSFFSYGQYIQLLETNKKVVLKFLEAWNNHDSIGLAALFTDDLVYRDNAFNAEKRTKAKLITFVNSTIKGVPDFRLDPVNFVVSDSTAVVEWIWTGTFTGGWGANYPANGKAFKVRGNSVMIIKDGLIRRNYDYYDKEPFRNK